MLVLLDPLCLMSSVSIYDSINFSNIQFIKDNLVRPKINEMLTLN